MKDAINYFIPIVKDPMNDITGRCITTNALESAYCGSYHPPKACNPPVFANHAHYPDVQMETNSMDIQYNNLIEMDDEQETAPPPPPHRQPASRKRNHYDYDTHRIANAKRCRLQNADPPLYHHLSSEQAAMASLPLAKIQTHQRHPTHNMPDMPRCMMAKCEMEDGELPNPIEHKRKPKQRDDAAHTEALLMHTHGTTAYHWQGHEI